jgi:hypothetical protein
MPVHVAGPLTSDCEQQRLLVEQPARAKAEAYREWLNRWDDLLWAPGRTRGGDLHLPRGLRRRRLVISGPQRGTSWMDERASQRPGSDAGPRTWRPSIDFQI